jgi:diguanylate cyclase (GGDEF)-like protein
MIEDYYDIDSMSGLDAATIEKIKGRASGLFSSDADALPHYINELIDTVEQQQSQPHEQDTFIAAVAIYFNAAFRHLCGMRKLRHSELYSFMRVVNHLPVLESSPFYTQTLDILTRHFRKDPKIVKLFDQLQMMNLFIELEYIEGAFEIEKALTPQIKSSDLHLYTLYQLCRFRLLNSSKNLEQLMDLVLNLIHQVYQAEGPESTIFLMLNWLRSLSWMKHSLFYKALLYNLLERIRNEASMNSAFVAYELFQLENRLVDPDAKYELYLHLIGYPASILNSRQLRALHFFAGNYLSSNKEMFRESILSFKSSNYYLHKCWERLVGISKYLRTHSSSASFKISISYLETKLLNLSHYTSMRNNCYVENLQASFDQIQELYQHVGELSLTDALTGLKNRRYQQNNLFQLAAIAARHQTPVCFAMLDIDFFKIVNDQFGHAAGDCVLKQLADILRDFRKSDVVIRYGGEEFLLVLFDTPLVDAEKLMLALKEKIAATTFLHNDHEIHISVSIGLTCECFNTHNTEQELNEFIEHSDIALYEAKKSGRNSICIYSAPVENPA